MLDNKARSWQTKLSGENITKTIVRVTFWSSDDHKLCDEQKRIYIRNLSMCMHAISLYMHTE